MQRAADQEAKAPVGSLVPFTPAPRLAAVGGPSGPQREVFGFALASSLSDPNFGYPTWNFSLLSTVAFFGLHVNDDGTLASDSGMSVWNSSQLTSLLTTAHSSGTKVVVTIIMQDFSSGTPHMCSALAHGATTIAATVAELRGKGVDGVNVDYEGLNGPCGSSDPYWARRAMTGFVGNLRAALPGGSYLSVDTYASSAADPIGFYDVGSMAVSADSFFVMAYDLDYSNYGRAPVSCPSYCLSPVAPLGGYYYNDTATAAQYVGAVGAGKVILGVPYYGRKACVGSANPNAGAGATEADSYLDASSENTNPGPGFVPGSYVAHRDANDPAGQERWDTWYNSSIPCTREMYWDDVVALSAKYDLVGSSNLRGVGIWNLNYGGGAPELWQALDAKFGAGAPHRIGGVITSAPDAAAWSTARTDVFVRGAEGGLWDATSTAGVWTWTYLGGRILDDPAAVSWGTNRLDVFVRGIDNALWHRAFYVDTWFPWEKLGGYITSGPDVVSWSPNRLAVYVSGSEHGLWQVAWDGVAWSWSFVGGRITSDPGAISISSNRIDVFARGTEGGLWQASWTGTGWVWNFLGGVFSTGPDASSCAQWHLDVFAVGADHKLWQRGFNGTSWGAWQSLGGQWQDSPTPICPPGATAVSVFERGADGALYQLSVPGT